MPDAHDMDLLRQFARDHSEAAFTELVRRHINLVYSVARRCTGNDGDAHDVTQAVFIILARKADSLGGKTILPGWLYETTRFTAARLLRTNARRHVREQEAFMQSTLNENNSAEVWEQLAPHLETAMGKLNAADRALLVLRFYENKTGAEAAAMLGIRDDAAHKRAARAIEKLRKFFMKRGVSISGATIAGAVSANSVQAAPVGLAKIISAVAVAKGAAATASTLTLVKGALKIMAWSKMKTGIVVGIGILIAAGTTTVVVEKAAHPKLSATDLSWLEDAKYWQMDSRVLNTLPSVLVLRPTHFPHTGGSISTGQRALGKNVSVKNLVANAYSFDFFRMVLKTDLPAGGFDYMMTPPYKPWTPLQGELKKQFGLTAHTETREVEVLQIKIKDSQPPKFKPGADGNSGMSSQSGEVKIENQPISTLANWLQGYFGMPITDHTGLLGQYDLSLKWTSNRGNPDPAERERIKQALLDQLGLELVPGREPVEMLIVEKVQ